MSIISRLFGSKSSGIEVNKITTSGTFSVPSGVAGCNITGAGGGGGGGAGILTTTTTTNIPSSLVPGTAGNITLGSSGNIWLNTGTSSGAALNIGGGLSKEEDEELGSLKEQREEETKYKKIAEFKKLPTELRQFITNCIMWAEQHKRIGELNLNKSAREIELETKQHNGGQLTWSNGTITLANPGYDPAIPDGLSGEDIKRAHTEAALEEQILDNE